MVIALKKDTYTTNSDLVLIEDKLKKFGHKSSSPRKIILDILKSKQKLMDADDVYSEVKKINPKIGIATIYRNLELLTKLNLICKINAGIGKSMYILSNDCRKDTSIYMICDNCRRVITNNKCLSSSIKIRLRDNAEKDILRNCKLKINNFQIVFTGLCNECAGA